MVNQRSAKWRIAGRIAHDSETIWVEIIWCRNLFAFVTVQHRLNVEQSIQHFAAITQDIASSRANLGIRVSV